MYYLVQFADKSQKVYNGCSSFKGNDGNRRTEDVKVGCDLLAPYNGTLYQCEVISITEEKPKKKWEHPKQWNKSKKIPE
jgi:hypothetical protein